MRAREDRTAGRRRRSPTAALRRGAALALAAVTLASCGGGNETAAATACVDAVQAKLAGRNYELRAKDLAGSAKTVGDEWHLSSQITFDKSLSSEYKQTVDCKVRLEAGKAPSVIFLQFNWSMDDVKKG
jgi:hypothetical protein